MDSQAESISGKSNDPFDAPTIGSFDFGSADAVALGKQFAPAGDIECLVERFDVNMDRVAAQPKGYGDMFLPQSLQQMIKRLVHSS